MKVVLMSMPDVAAVIMHEAAFHMPSLGIASLAANIDTGHDVYVIDLSRKRRNVRSYVAADPAQDQARPVGLFLHDLAVRHLHETGSADQTNVARGAHL